MPRTLGRRKWTLLWSLDILLMYGQMLSQMGVGSLLTTASESSARAWTKPMFLIGIDHSRLTTSVQDLCCGLLAKIDLSFHWEAILWKMHTLPLSFVNICIFHSHTQDRSSDVS
jgi:hypothetical protein